MNRFLRNAILSLSLMFALGVVAQEHEAKPQEPAKAEHPSNNPNARTDKELSTASSAAEGKKVEAPEQEEEEEYAQLKQSPSVRWVAEKLGISPRLASTVLFIANFAVLAFFTIYLWRKNVPTMMRNRGVDIRKGIEEAQKASAEATARLTQIEARLSKLDSEIAALQATSEADFRAEEARIKQQAEEDARHVVENAQQEIEAATRSAQRELKVFAADLAVSLAEKKIKVDSKTDEELVRGFVTQLGKDGK